MRRSALLVLGLLAVAAPTLAAQADGTPRDLQMKMLENQRKLLLAMADSMPEAQYRDKVTPIQRDFAQQIHHAATAVANISAGMFKAPRPTLPDTAATFGSRAGLKSFINASFDYATNLCKTQTAADRAQSIKFFGETIPGWQVWDEIQTHTVWTAGQVVANFRKHGMAPPAFTFF